MKLVIAIAALVLLAFPAHAGSITITYKNTAGTVTETATATISDADAATLSTWTTAYFPGNPTGQAAWNAWADSIFAQLAANVKNYQINSVAVTPIVITPAQ